MQTKRYKIWLLLSILVSIIFLVSGNVKAEEFVISSDSTYLQEERANELEYIFTYLYSEDENGNYIENELTIQNSSYTLQEKASIAKFVDYMNSENGYETHYYYKYVSPFRSSWFERCLRDTYNLTKPSIDSIVADVRNKNFWAASAKLFTAIKVGQAAVKYPKITIAIAFGYLMVCGPETVS